MKGKILLGCILISGITLALENTEASYEKMNKKYQSLAKKEQMLYEKKEQEARKASVKLEEQKRLYSELSEKKEHLEGLKDTRYYKKQYKAVINQMGVLLKELESKIGSNKVIVDDFNTLNSIRNTN